VWLRSFFGLGAGWGWVIDFAPRPRVPRGVAPGADWMGDWVGPGAGLDAVVGAGIPSPCWDLKIHFYGSFAHGSEIRIIISDFDTRRKMT